MEWHLNPKQLLKFLGSNHYICGWLAIKLEKMFGRVKIHFSWVVHPEMLMEDLFKDMAMEVLTTV